MRRHLLILPLFVVATLSCGQGRSAPSDVDAGHNLGAIRPPVPQALASWLVTDWYIHPSTGSDSSTCTDAGHPCKTFSELVARWQTSSPQLGQATTLHFLADQPDLTDPIDWTPQIMALGSAYIVGSTTTIATTTLGTVTPKNRASGTPLKANLGAPASTYQNLLIVNSTHPSVAWVDTVAGSVATLSQPVVSNAPAAPATYANLPAEVDTTTAGDSVTIQRPVKINLNRFAPTVRGAVTTTGGGWVTHVWVGNSFSQLLLLTDIALSECRIDAASYSDRVSFANSIATTLTSKSILQNSFFISGVISNGQFTAAMLDGDVIVHGVVNTFGSAGWGSPGNTGDTNVLGFVYSDGTIHGNSTVILPNQNAYYGGSTLYGTYSVSLENNASYYYTSPPAFTGTPTLLLGGVQVATAQDTSLSPAPSYPNRNLTVAALDQSIAAGGFAGDAMSADLRSAFININTVQHPPTPTAYVAPVANGGLGLSSVCPNGQAPISNGTGYTCATPGGGGLSCPVNMASCATGILSTTNGGTGVAGLCPNGQILQSNGSAYTCVTPSGGGLSCPVSLSACTTGLLPPANGGLGTNETVCSGIPGAILEWNGIGQVGCITPAGAGTVLTSAGATLPVYRPIDLSGSGTQFSNTLTPALGGLGASETACSNINGAVMYWNGAGQANCLTPGATGTVVTSTGNGTTPVAWQQPATGTTSWIFANGGTLIPATNAITIIGSSSITIPAGHHILIQGNAFFSNPDTSPDDVTYGIGIGSASYVLSHTLTVAANTAGFATGKSAGPFLFKTSTSGPTTVFCLASSLTQTFTAGCELLLSDVL